MTEQRFRLASWGHGDLLLNVAPEDVTVVAEVGRGSFGLVELVLVKRESTFIYAARKTVELRKQSTVKHLANELDLQEACALSGFTVAPLGVYLSSSQKSGKEYIHCLLEYQPCGDLLRLTERLKGLQAPTMSASVPQYPGRLLAETKGRFLAACLLAGISYIHSRGMAHRDIKPSNCLLDAQGYLRIADFGLAVWLQPNGRAYGRCGTPEYSAPEVMNLASAAPRVTEYDGRAADMWSVGVTLHYFMTGHLPGRNGAVCGSIPISPLRRLLKCLLRLEPHQRLNVSEAMHHDWFEGFDWAALVNKRMPSPLELPPATCPCASCQEMCPEASAANQACQQPAVSPWPYPESGCSSRLPATTGSDAAAAPLLHHHHRGSAECSGFYRPSCHDTDAACAAATAQSYTMDTTNTMLLQHGPALGPATPDAAIRGTAAAAAGAPGHVGEAHHRCEQDQSGPALFQNPSPSSPKTAPTTPRHAFDLGLPPPAIPGVDSHSPSSAPLVHISTTAMQQPIYQDCRRAWSSGGGAAQSSPKSCPLGSLLTSTAYACRPSEEADASTTCASSAAAHLMFSSSSVSHSPSITSTQRSHRMTSASAASSGVHAYAHHPVKTAPVHAAVAPFDRYSMPLTAGINAHRSAASTLPAVAEARASCPQLDMQAARPMKRFETTKAGQQTPRPGDLHPDELLFDVCRLQPEQPGSDACSSPRVPLSIASGHAGVNNLALPTWNCTLYTPAPAKSESPLMRARQQEATAAALYARYNQEEAEEGPRMPGGGGCWGWACFWARRH